MGFNRRELPELDKLKEIHQNIGNDLEFIKFIVGKSDVLTGSVDSYIYLEEIYERTNKDYKNGNRYN
jgi:hypothetical protein